MASPDKLARITWWLDIAAVVAYCLTAFFFWSLVDLVTPFGAPFLWLPVVALALAALVASMVLVFRRWKTRLIASLMPFAFLAACFVLAGFVDFTAIWLSADFRLKRTDREEVVRRISSGEFRPNVSHNKSLIALPKRFASVSLGGGEVCVQRDGDKLKVLFYTFRGVLNPFAGFVYSSDGSAPKNGDFGGRIFINRNVGAQWYYISAR